MHFELEQFSGPLDLLLHLLEEEELSISEISLSQVTEQYLDFTSEIDEKRAEELVDFLVVAAKLVFLKSKKLLPQFLPEEDEDGDLEEQLRLYKLFVDASEYISSFWLDNKKSLFRKEPLRKSEEFTPPDNFNAEELRESFEKLLYRLTPPKPLPKTHIDKAVSMKEKISRIHKLLKQKKRASFFDIVDSASNKTDVIVSFLALLELVKQKTVTLKQDESFGDIEINRA